MDLLNQSLLSAKDRLEQGILRIDLVTAELHARAVGNQSNGPFSADGPWMRQLVQQREVLVATVEFISNLMARSRSATNAE